MERVFRGPGSGESPAGFAQVALLARVVYATLAWSEVLVEAREGDLCSWRLAPLPAARALGSRPLPSIQAPLPWPLPLDAAVLGCTMRQHATL